MTFPIRTAEQTGAQSLSDLPEAATAAPAPREARDWIRVLAKYREPMLRRSMFELAVTLVPFVAIWALAWWALSISPWISLGLSVINAGFLVRIFCIQHDCGHGSFFGDRRANDWTGRALGVLTLTPYDVWKRVHAVHHSHAGNLDRRGIGEIQTLTVEEYRALGWARRLQYRVYRNPLMLFGLAPTYLFFLENRLPVGMMRAGGKYWLSAMGTNLAVLAALGAIFWFGGWAPLLLIFVPTTAVAATIGVWLFYVQHQFEEAHWDHEDDWQVHDAALHGSSHYDLPAVLRWFSANIGVHHVHHLYARIPFYRLTEVLRDHGELADYQRLSLRESLACARLHLWDKQSRRMVSFAEARALPRPA